MRKLTLTIALLLAITGLVTAQKVSVAPTSIQAWGRTMDTQWASVEYKSVGLHVFNVATQYHTDSGEEAGGKYYSVSYKPIQFRYAELGLIAFNKPFPFKESTRVNFWVELKLPIGDHMELSYVHISNGYLGKINTGLDTFSVTVKL
jgi:hypothetical protein